MGYAPILHLAEPSGCEKTIEIEKMLIGNQPVMQLRRLKNGVFSQTAVVGNAKKTVAHKPYFILTE